jgi:DNA-binding Lrp family transcriptional regulator
MRADEIDDRDQAILRALMSGGRLTNLSLAERAASWRSPRTTCRASRSPRARLPLRTRIW